MESRLDMAPWSRPAWQREEAVRWSLAWSAVGLLWVVAVALTVRRFTGHLQTPLPIGVCWGAATTMVIAAQLARLSVWRVGLHGSTACGLSITLPVLLFGAAVTLPGAAPAATYGFWVLLLAGEVVGWRWLTIPRTAGLTVWEQRSITRHDANPDGETPLLPAEVTQQQERRCEAGRETISGMFREQLVVGQRVAQAHLAFCPPFAQTPELRAEFLKGPEAGLKVAQVLPHGARIEIRLRRTADAPQSVVFRFVAEGPQIAPPPSAREHHLRAGEHSSEPA